jgi:hypothetical protein
MTHVRTVRDVRRARAVYADVLGGRMGTGENLCIVRLANGRVIMNPGAGPTPDKPDVELVPYEASRWISSFMNLRVADTEASYHDWLARGAHFLPMPLDRDTEIRCCMRDSDGYLIEVGQATGLVERRLAEKAPAGGDAGGTDGR